MTFKTQAEAKRVIQASIDANDRAVYKALLIIYSQQTASEQACQTTQELNKRGFGAFDAEILSSFAEQVRERGRLSAKQMELARKKIRHYWKQLAILSGGLKVTA
jgi:hypothetical protein